MRRIPLKSSPGLDKRNERRNFGILGEGRTEWQTAATSLHDDVFLTPKNVTSERPIALMPTLTRWWEALKAPEVAKWQQKYRVDWDATDGRNGGAQRTVWEVLMEMEKWNRKAKAEEQGAVALVQDLAKAFERVSLPVSGLGRRTSASPKRSCWCFVVFRAPEACTVRWMCGGTAPHHHGHPARVQVELFASTCCLARCAE